jgi:hypothetical protein
MPSSEVRRSARAPVQRAREPENPSAVREAVIREAEKGDERVRNAVADGPMEVLQLIERESG